MTEENNKESIINKTFLLALFIAALGLAVTIYAISRGQSRDGLFNDIVAIVGVSTTCLGVLISIVDPLMHKRMNILSYRCEICHLDKFCGLHTEDSFFAENDIVRRYTTNLIQDAVSSTSECRRGVLKLQSSSRLYKIIRQVVGSLDNALIDVYEFISDNEWPTAFTDTVDLESFDIHTSQLSNILAKAKQYKIVFVGPRNDYFSRNQPALVSIAFHWWFVNTARHLDKNRCITDSDLDGPQNFYRLTYDYNKIASITSPIEVWHIHENKPGGREVIAIVPKINVGGKLQTEDGDEHFEVHFGISTVSNSICNFLTYCREHPELNREINVDFLNEELYQLDETTASRFVALRCMRDHWFLNKNNLKIVDLALYYNSIEDWISSEFHREILWLSRQVVNCDRKVTRIFPHNLRGDKPRSKKMLALQVVQKHLDCGVQVGLMDIDSENILGEEIHLPLRDFCCLEGGKIAFEVVQDKARPFHAYLTENEQDKNVRKDLAELFKRYKAICYNSEHGAILDKQARIESREKLKRYFGIV